MSKPNKGDTRFAVSEQELEAAVEAARGGDEMAFALLWRENNSRLTKFVQARTYKSDLDFEEIVSEVWMNVAKDVRKFKGDYSGFTAWVYSIARNRIVDASRKRDRTIRPQEELDEATWVPSNQNVEKDFEADANVKRIIDEINKLPAAQAEVLMLRVVSDLSVEEVAKIVKKNANSVRVLAHRGMTTLKESLGGSHE
jgi:RNA polymerase sigma-70 factor (ECF subfamily)